MRNQTLAPLTKNNTTYPSKKDQQMSSLAAMMQRIETPKAYKEYAPEHTKGKRSRKSETTQPKPEAVPKNLKRKRSTPEKGQVKKPKHSDDALVVYTDGSCLKNGASGRSGGVGVWFGKDDARNISEKFTDTNPSNQRTEIKAIIRALETVDPSVDLIIRSDSEYAIKCQTEWRSRWIKNGWMTAGGKPVSNQDLLKPYFALVDARRGRLVFEHVSAHVGIEGNEAADTLAKQGAYKK